MRTDPPANAEQIIGACVRACVAARDGRGRWRPIAACDKALLASVASPAISAATAAAAARFGAWLGERSTTRLGAA